MDFSNFYNSKINKAASKQGLEANGVKSTYIPSLHQNKFDEVSFSGRLSLKNNNDSDFSNFESRKKYLKQVKYPFKSNNKQKWGEYELELCAGLEEEQFGRFASLLEDENTKKLMQEGKLSENNLVNLCKLSETEYKNFSELIKNEGFYLLLEVSPNCGCDMLAFAQADEKELERLDSFVKNDCIKELLRNKSLECYAVWNLVNQEEDKFQKLNLALNNENFKNFLTRSKASEDTLSLLSKLNEQEFVKLDSILQDESIVRLFESESMDAKNISSFLSFGEKEVERLKSLLKNDNINELLKKNKMHFHDFVKLVFLEDQEFNSIEPTLEDGDIQALIKDDKFDGYCLCNMATFDDEQHAQFKTALKNKNIQYLLQNKALDCAVLVGYSKLEEKDFENQLKLLSDDRTKKLVKAGMPLIFFLENRVKFPLMDFADELEEDTQGYKFTTEILQNDSGFQIVARKEVPSVNNSEYELSKLSMKGFRKMMHDFFVQSAKGKNADWESYLGPQTDDKVNITKTITLQQDGTISRSTNEASETGGRHRAWNQDSDRTVLLTKINEDKDVLSQIEIVNDENGEPSYILHTKESNELEGAYETVKYNLADYPEDMDVVKAIAKGKIKGGETISKVSSNDGAVTYEQSFKHNGCNTRRNYSKSTDENGNIDSYNYLYNITGKDGKSLLNIKRSWAKNPDGSTTTIINGKKLIAKFDYDNMSVALTDEDGSTTMIDLSKNFLGRSLVEHGLEAKESVKEEFFEFIKTLPADQLKMLASYNKISIVETLDSEVCNKTKHLKVGLSLPVLAHEEGHSIDYLGEKSEDEIVNISKNKELIQIYNKEMRLFKEEYPEISQKVIKYFSDTKGGSVDTGLSEVVAETNMLATTYGLSIDSIKTRSLYLVKYFPETVAKAAELLGHGS